MSIDTYAICPCGTGKKIKFCYKCKDSVHELDKVIKMIEGGQLVPALDRLSSILEEHPDAAWALAIRGRLFMDLREYASLEENAARFRRLQPSNPVAISQSAAAALFRQDIAKATELVLEALTESGQSVDSFVLDVSSLLSYALAGNGIPLTARVYATLPMVSSGYEDQRLAADVLRQLNSDPQINLLAKSVPALVPRPTDATWGERYDEAAMLLASNKVVLAETKFDSLQRVAPMQPEVLSGLLNCAIWRGDHEKQAELLTKLSQCDELELDDRARYLAMASTVSPEANQLTLKQFSLEAEFDSIDEPNQALLSSSRFASLPPETLTQLKSEDGVLPKSAFQLLDRDALTDGVEATSENVPTAMALVLVHGKQTDRAARVEVLGLAEPHRDAVIALLNDVVSEQDWKPDDVGVIPLESFVTPQIAGVPAGGLEMDSLESLQRDLLRSRGIEILLNSPIPLLGDATLAGSARNDAKSLGVAAVLRYLECESSLTASAPELLPKLFESLGLSPPPEPAPTSEELEDIPNDELNRVDVQNLDREGLVYLIQRSLQVSTTLVGRRASEALLALPDEGDDVSAVSVGEASAGQDADAISPAAAKMVAYSFLIQRGGTSKKILETIQQAKAHAEANEMSDASLLLAEASLHIRRGDGEAFQSCVQTITTKYGQNPEVMQRLQQMLIQLGLIRPDGRPAAPPPAASDSSSAGLWTPDSGSPAIPAPATSSPAAAAPASAAAPSGGSKLWVPGMD